MVITTEQFKQQLNKVVRDESYIKIVFGVSNPDTPQASNFSDNGHLYYSDVNALDLGYNVSETYDTLERGRFVLNGKNLLALPSSSASYQGFVSEMVSNNSGEFVGTQPTISINFGDVFFEFGGLTFTFDETMKNYPTSFRIICRNGTDVVYDKTHNPTEPKFICKDTIPVCNNMTLTFNNMNVGNRRLRLHDMIWGITDVLLDGDISDCKLVSTSDLISTSLPTNTFSFSIFDIHNRYNPDNPDNLIQYLENGQSIKYYLGQKLESGSIEWIPMYTGYTTGDVSISSGGNTKTIGINSVALLGRLDTVYHGGTYLSTGTSLYDMAMDMVTYAGYPNSIKLPESMKNIKTTGLANGRTVKEGLQLVANACGMALNMSRDGIIEFVDMSPQGTVGYNFSKFDMYDLPQTNRISQVQTVASKYFVNNVSTTNKVIATIKTSGSVATEYNVIYGKSANVTYTSSGCTISGTPTLTSTSGTFVATGTGTITISGNAIEVVENIVNKRVHEVGLELEVSNELVDSETFLNTYITSIMKYYDRRTDYSFSNRGVPYLDIGDTVTTETNYEGVKKGTIYSNEITFNGTISGNSKILEFNE